MKQQPTNLYARSGTCTAPLVTIPVFIWRATECFVQSVSVASAVQQTAKTIHTHTCKLQIEYTCKARKFKSAWIWSNNQTGASGYTGEPNVRFFHHLFFQHLSTKPPAPVISWLNFSIGQVHMKPMHHCKTSNILKNQELMSCLHGMTEQPRNHTLLEESCCHPLAQAQAHWCGKVDSLITT